MARQDGGSGPSATRTAATGARRTSGATIGGGRLATRARSTARVGPTPRANDPDRSARPAAVDDPAGGSGDQAARRHGYVLPLVHTRIPEPLVNVGFFGALGATAALGIVDAPLALLIGAAVVVAHHHRP